MTDHEMEQVIQGRTLADNRIDKIANEVGISIEETIKAMSILNEKCQPSDDEVEIFGDENCFTIRLKPKDSK